MMSLLHQPVYNALKKKTNLLHWCWVASYIYGYPLTSAKPDDLLEMNCMSYTRPTWEETQQQKKFILHISAAA